jgi:hypothetical protein
LWLKKNPERLGSFRKTTETHMIVLSKFFHELKMDETELKKWSTNLPCCKRSNICDLIEGLMMLLQTTFGTVPKMLCWLILKRRKFQQGLIDGIIIAGEQLKQHFPWSEDDTNELSNEISKGE